MCVLLGQSWAKDRWAFICVSHRSNRGSGRQPNQAGQDSRILKFGGGEEQGLFIPQFAGEAGSTRSTTLVPGGHSCSLVQGSQFHPHLCGQQPHLAWTLLLRTGILWKLECLLGWISIRSFSDRRKLGISTARADKSL